MKIVTNNHERLLFEVRDELAFRYKGEVYSLSDFEVSPIAGWDGVHPLTYYFGVLVRFSKVDPDYVVVGAYCY